MPTVELKSEDMTALVAYLRSLGTSVGGRKRGVSSPARAANPVAGKRTYAQHCADCHGPTGKGDGTVGRALRLTPTDFTAAPIDDAEWLKVIELGSKAAGKSDGMKGFAGELTDVQIRDVLAHVKTLMKSLCGFRGEDHLERINEDRGCEPWRLRRRRHADPFIAFLKTLRRYFLLVAPRFLRYERWPHG
jgi:mono/diheme cytochrome c family protein